MIRSETEFERKKRKRSFCIGDPTPTYHKIAGETNIDGVKSASITSNLFHILYAISKGGRDAGIWRSNCLNAAAYDWWDKFCNEELKLG